MDNYNLAIDFGTSFSSAAMTTGQGATTIEVQGERKMPSVVLLHEDCSLVVGPAALSQAALYPERVERTPKRYLGQSALLLGGTGVPVSRVVGAVLATFLTESKWQRDGRPPTRVALTHPARWEQSRYDALRAAAEDGGFNPSSLDLIPEPVAAAAHYLTDAASRHRTDGVARGAYVAVYDLGGGTFDTAVLQQTGDGFEVVGPPGGDERIGGEDFDHRISQFAGQTIAHDLPEVWTHLCESTETQWKVNRTKLLEQARTAKEMLSTHTTAAVYIPGAEREITLTRNQFEGMIYDDLVHTVDELEQTIERANLSPAQLAAIYLVGGSSRIPLVTRLATERFGDRITTWDDPQTVVALGAAKALPPQPPPRREEPTVGGPAPDRGPDGGLQTGDPATGGPGAGSALNRKPAGKRAVLVLVWIVVGIVGLLILIGVVGVILGPDTPPPNPPVNPYYLDQLADACYSGDMSSCDSLYFESPVGSDYERYGATCGGRSDRSYRGNCS